MSTAYAIKTSVLNSSYEVTPRYHDTEFMFKGSDGKYHIGYFSADLTIAEIKRILSVQLNKKVKAIVDKSGVYLNNKRTFASYNFSKKSVVFIIF